jgi:formylglycine-generating enzyme required for sulfatase activity
MTPAEQSNTPEPEQRVFILPGGTEMAFRLIPARRFRMGSRGFSPNEEPCHGVTICRPFWMAETPVTQAQFAEWTQAEATDHRNEWGGRDREEHPAASMDWRRANAFCDWMTRVVPQEPANKMPAGYRLFCLPTEAEWEYACRAGTETAFHTGDGEAALAEAGRFGLDWKDGTRPVRLGAKNRWGLYDLHGHVWQWCHDVDDSDAYRQRWDGGADVGARIRNADWAAGLSALNDPTDARNRVLRGGSWGDDAWYCRSACRIGGRPGEPYGNHGFRVCLVRGPAAEGGAREQNELAKAAQGTGVGGQGTGPETDGTEAAGAEVDLPSEYFAGAAGRKHLPTPTSDEPLV